MKEIKALAKLIVREFKLFKTNSVAVAIFIGAPLLYGLIFGFVYNNAKVNNVPISVLDLDETPLSHTLIDMLEDNEYVRVEHIRHNESEIREDLLNNIVAVISIPKGFEGDIQQKRHPEIQVDVNGANIVTANYANLGIRTVLGTFNAGIEIKSLNKKGIPTAIAKEQFEAFKINVNRYFNTNSNYLRFMWPGMMGTLMQQVFLLVMALSFAREFETGSFSSLKQISDNPFSVLTAKSLPYWVMGVLLWGAIQWGFFPLFKMPVIHDQWALFVLVAMFMLALTNLGVLVSWVIPDQLRATEILMVIATPSFVLSGFTWPLSEMPVPLQALAQAIPLTHFLSAFRKVMFYGSGVNEIIPELNNLAITAVITGVVCLILVTLKLRKTSEKNTEDISEKVIA
ncbi:ABC transporter permease [Limibacter armeniacum]|uniref:ABC transporter permease n=1 Tax=Limibacter armeniacum TaxID=466084 RepID=UPI002FE5C56B